MMNNLYDLFNHISWKRVIMYEESNDTNLKMSNSVLISIIVGLASISSGIILAYSTLPSWSIYIAIILIIVMTFVLLWISPLPYIIKKKRERRISNKLASTHFQKLIKKNFISQFEKNLSDDISFTFHNIVMRIKSKHSEFNSIPDPQVELIKQRFYFWLNCLNHFDKKIDDKILTLLLEEFRSIIIAYCHISAISNDISKIKNKSEIEINDQEKEWKKAVNLYNDFRNPYNTYLEEVNKDFKEIRPGIPWANEL